jgi:uncharacterized RDD family membrane protein YckC
MRSSRNISSAFFFFPKKGFNRLLRILMEYPDCEGVNAMGVDETTPESVNAWESSPAGVGLRAAATILDWFILVFTSIFLSFLPESISQQPDVILTLMLVGGLLYYIFFEGKFGATPGKMLIGLKVVYSDGSPCDYKAATIRTLLRVVDALPILYLLGLISILVSPRKQRLGDRLADTLVVKGIWLKLRLGGNRGQ